MHYVKAYSTLFTSTIWAHPKETKLIWISFLIAADQDGFVHGTVPGMAQLIGVTIQEMETALEVFLSPDKYSSTKEHEGRRIEEVDGGWFILNHAKYKSMKSTEQRREYKRAHSARYRAELKAKAQSEADAKALQDAADAPPLATDDVDEFKD